MTELEEKAFFDTVTVEMLEKELGEPLVKITTFAPQESLLKYGIGTDAKRAGKVADATQRYLEKVANGGVLFINVNDPCGQLEHFVTSEFDFLKPDIEQALVLTGVEFEKDFYTLHFGLYKAPLIIRDEDDLRKMFMDRIRENAQYWEGVALKAHPTDVAKAVREAVEGVTFGVLTYLDGVNMSNVYGVKLYMKDPYREDDGNDWLCINDRLEELHDELYPIFNREPEDDD